MNWRNGFAAVGLIGGVLPLGTANVSARPLTSAGKDIASGETSSMPVAARRAALSAPRIGGPRIAARPVIRPPHPVRPPRVVRRPGVIVGVTPGYYEPYPYNYEPYYLEVPDDTDEIAYCIGRLKSYKCADADLSRLRWAASSVPLRLRTNRSDHKVAVEARVCLRTKNTIASGHSQFGEWVFGGVTRELRASYPICCHTKCAFAI